MASKQILFDWRRTPTHFGSNVKIMRYGGKPSLWKVLSCSWSECTSVAMGKNAVRGGTAGSWEIEEGTPLSGGTGEWLLNAGSVIVGIPRTDAARRSTRRRATRCDSQAARLTRG